MPVRDDESVGDKYNNDTSLPSYPPTFLSSKKAAFTLAEVLITLAIVGVVAAITLPPLVTNIQSQIRTKRIENIQQKFSKATDKMLAMSGMSGYGSTENFVEELKHHLKIAKVCDNDHLNECWGYEKVKLSDGKEWEIAKTKTGKNLKMTDDETHEWDNTTGIVTADGTSIILSYNKKCDMSTNVNPQWNGSKSTSTNCIAAVYDWNGGKNPNMFDSTNIKSDVMAINAGGLGSSCRIEVNDKCFGDPIMPSAEDATKYGYTWCAGHAPEKISNSGQYAYGPQVVATGEAAALGINKCAYIYDYWNAAVALCGGKNKMATMEDLAAIANKIYGTKIGAYDDIEFIDDIPNSLDTIGAISVSMSFPDLRNARFWVWLGLEANSADTYYRSFSQSFSEWNNNRPRRESGGYTLCVVD